jgi:hypothetical protein
MSALLSSSTRGSQKEERRDEISENSKERIYRIRFSGTENNK